jgi:hypothetical protein
MPARPCDSSLLLLFGILYVPQLPFNGHVLDRGLINAKNSEDGTGWLAPMAILTKGFRTPVAGQRCLYNSFRSSAGSIKLASFGPLFAYRRRLTCHVTMRSDGYGVSTLFASAAEPRNQAS